jgi:hypothetical protein
MQRVTLKSNAKLQYRRAFGNGEVLQRLLDEDPRLKYGEYTEPRRAGDRFGVEFETTREGVGIVVLSQILFNGTLSDTHHYILPKSDFEKLFSGSHISTCCD